MTDNRLTTTMQAMFNFADDAKDNLREALDSPVPRGAKLAARTGFKRAAKKFCEEKRMDDLVYFALLDGFEGGEMYADREKPLGEWHDMGKRHRDFFDRMFQQKFGKQA